MKYEVIPHPLKEIAFFPLRRKRGFGIMVVLNLSAAQMWFCEFPQAAAWLADGAEEGFCNYLIGENTCL